MTHAGGWNISPTGPHAGFFAKPIEKADTLIVPTICILEVFKRVYQQGGEDNALCAVAAMSQGQVVEMGAHFRNIPESSLWSRLNTFKLLLNPA